MNKNIEIKELKNMLMIKTEVNYSHIIDHNSKNEYYVINGMIVNGNFEYDTPIKFTSHLEALKQYKEYKLSKVNEFKEIIYSPLNKNKDNESVIREVVVGETNIGC